MKGSAKDSTVEPLDTRRTSIKPLAKTLATNLKCCFAFILADSFSCIETIERLIDKAPCTSASERTMVSETHAIDDCCTGMILAEFAITDNGAPKTALQCIAGSNPWHEQAMKMVVDDPNAPLAKILKESMQLELDHVLDISGITPGGHFLDTQGYIAHSDDKIVLSYRCTTSAFDWMTNFNSTSSVWEVQEDALLGFSGCCSGLEGWCGTDSALPRVHTGFYNNFLASLPFLEQYIEPLLGADQPLRTLYVVGHSLGGGIATLASCYFALKYPWETLPQTLISVTAGAPRACGTSMKEHMEAAGVLQHCRFYRLKCGVDLVPALPPKAMGFCHLTEAIVLTQEDGGEKYRIYWDKASRRQVEAEKGGDTSLTRGIPPKHDEDSSTEDESTDEDDPERRDAANRLQGSSPSSSKVPSVIGVSRRRRDSKRRSSRSRSKAVEDEHSESDDQAKYQALISKIPLSLRHHMPDFYLKPLLEARAITQAKQLWSEPMCFGRSASTGRTIFVPPPSRTSLLLSMPRPQRRRSSSKKWWNRARSGLTLKRGRSRSRTNRSLSTAESRPAEE